MIHADDLYPRHRPRLLFVCSGNTCRSQMAEGWTRALFGDRLEAYSAGIETHRLDPHAVAVMAEAGIDISGHFSKSIDIFTPDCFDWIIVLSARAEAHLEAIRFPGRIVRMSCLSPSRRAGSTRPSLAHYRSVRDEIKDLVCTLAAETVASPVSKSFSSAKGRSAVHVAMREAG
jgi:arsenate reductase